MATVTRKDINNKFLFANTPYGNATRLTYNLTCASGVWTDSDHTDTIKVDDTLVLGIIPAGFEIHDMLLTVSVAFTAATTCSIGYAYVDGAVGVPAADAAYFVPATQALSSTAIIRKTGTKAPAKLPRDCYLTLLWAGDTNVASGVLDIDVLGIWTGLPA